MKNRKWLKLTAAMLAVLLMSSSMAACGEAPASKAEGETSKTESSAAAQEESSTAETAAEPFGKYGEPVEITAVKNLGAGALEFPEGDSIDSNVWTREYEETLGVKVKFLWTTNEQQYDQKVNIAITSNDIPDVMTVKSTQLKMMYDNGQLMDMTDAMDQYLAPFTKETMNSDGGTGLKSATFDDRLMAIPQVGSALGSANVLWVRQDWLDKLKIKAPTTIDELLAVAEAFTTKDPDGNGKNDTYGLAVHKDLFEGGYSALEGFFNSYGAYPNIWIPKDDGLQHGSVQPEAKTALQTLQTLYSKGQLDPEFGVKDANKVNEDVGAGRFGLMFGQFWNAAWLNDAKVKNPDMEWNPIALPANGSTAAKSQLPVGTSSYFAVSSKCKNPEALVKMLNLQLKKSYGETAEPTKYNITPEGYGPYAYTIVSVEPPMKNFVAAQKVTKAIEGGESDIAALNDEEKNYYDMSMLSLGGDHTNNNWHQLKMFGPGGTLTVMQKYWDDGNVMPDEFYGAPTETMTEKLATLKKQQLTDFTAIIMGESIDKFDSFVENWNNLGGQKMTDEVNEWYKNR